MYLVEIQVIGVKVHECSNQSSDKSFAGDPGAIFKTNVIKEGACKLILNLIFTSFPEQNPVPNNI